MGHGTANFHRFYRIYHASVMVLPDLAVSTTVGDVTAFPVEYTVLSLLPYSHSAQGQGAVELSHPVVLLSLCRLVLSIGQPAMACLAPRPRDATIDRGAPCRVHVPLAGGRGAVARLPRRPPILPTCLTCK